MSSINIEVFSTGKHHGDNFTDADLDTMVSNFNELRGQVQPPLKANVRESDGQPSLGWMRGLKKWSGN